MRESPFAENLKGRGSTMTTNQTNAGSPTRYVFVMKIRCPCCHSVDLQTSRSIETDDGARQRTTRCRTCGHKFFVILE